MGKKTKDLDLAKKITERLKEVRKEAGKKQEDVRFDLGVNIGRLEVSQFCISLPTLKKLCDYYGITLEEFFKGME